jgi:hypothetical protein
MDFKIKTSRELTLDDHDVRDILLQYVSQCFSGHRVYLDDEPLDKEDAYDLGFDLIDVMHKMEREMARRRRQQ